MFEKHLLCGDCKKRFPADEPVFRCIDCGGSLEVIFDYGRLRKRMRPPIVRNRPFGHMRYHELFPVMRPIQAGEGATPMVRSNGLEARLDLDFRLWFKLESQNPTGSFKDRGSSIEVAKAVEFMEGRNRRYDIKRAVACASTGNMGASVAAYSGIAGIRCTIVTPSDAAPVKLEQILAHGARVFRIKGDYTRAAQIVEKVHREKRIYLLGDYLYRREGTKSVGYEILDQLPGADYVFCPIGNGTLASALAKSFMEMKELGFAKRLPRLAGIQASGCNPVVRGIGTGKAEPMKGARTVAVAMECGSPLDGDRAIAAIRQTRGLGKSVTDKEILRSRDLLARHEATFAEPAGAAALAGIIKLKNEIPRGSDVVCLVTGHGLKTPYTGIGDKVINTGPSPGISRLV